MPKRLEGRPAAAQIMNDLASQLDQQLAPLTLAIVMVGDNPASAVYVRKKVAAAAQLGIQTVVNTLPSSTSQAALLDLIEEWNTTATITGILVQLPLPSQFDTQQLLEMVRPDKDVDGLTSANRQAVANGDDGLVPATAEAVMALLDFYEIRVKGMAVAVVGRSALVGHPTALLLKRAGALVEVVHRQTHDGPAVIKGADIIVSAAGQPGLITAEMVKPGATIIDVGTTQTAKGLRGDVAEEVWQTKVEAISPVPGGVGPLTVACLMANVVKAARLQRLFDDQPSPPLQ